MENLSQLLALQSIDKEIVRIEREQDRLPNKLSKSYQEVLDVKQSIEDKKEHIQKLKLEEKENELEIKSIDELIAKKKGQLATAKTNIEYKTLLQEIENQNASRARAEEKGIELIDNAEKERTQLQEIESQYNKIADEYEEYRAQVEKELQSLAKELQKTQIEREKKYKEIQEIEPGTLSEYERIFENLRGDVLVPVQDEYCTSCHMEILPKDMADLLCKRLVYCEGCFRVLYLPEIVS